MRVKKVLAHPMQVDPSEWHVLCHAGKFCIIMFLKFCLYISGQSDILYEVSELDKLR